jgi:polysaccharide biosynthesis/export protein
MSLSQRAAQSAVCAVLACLTIVSPATAQPASPPAPATPQSQLTPPYRINAGDDLEVYVWGEERLQRVVRVLPDGTFAFPLVGQVVAQGKLPVELEAMISDRLKGQYRGQVPQVTVSVKSPTGTQFSVIGKVKSPGTFTPGRYVTILDACRRSG